MLKQATEALEEVDRARSARNAAPPPMPPVVPQQPPPGAPPNAEQLFHTICDLLQRYVYFRRPEYPIAVAIWMMHTHVFEKFPITPPLHLKSATLGEGKTTLFDVLEKLVWNPERDDSITAAMVASRANAPPSPTFLLDEADNLGLMGDPLFRSILNSGYKSTGRRSVMSSNRQWIRQRTFAPMALASIRNLPGPLMRRSVIIEMRPGAQAHQGRSVGF